MDYAEHTNFYFKLCIQCNSCLNIYSIDLLFSHFLQIPTGYFKTIHYICNEHKI